MGRIPHTADERASRQRRPATALSQKERRKGDPRSSPKLAQFVAASELSLDFFLLS
jgi:hypothetical protein